MANKKLGENQGEGNREAARRYNEAASKRARRNAEKDASPENPKLAREMAQAEEKGKSRAREP